jgi:L-amino acid N-acyltransferase YncA
MSAGASVALPAVRTRAAGIPDREGVARLLREMDRHGLYQRHFAHGEGPNLALLARFEQLGHGRHAMVVAQTADGRIIGHGEYAPADDGVEFALMVQPQWRQQGIARAMLKRLCRLAADAGEREISGLVKADNLAMLRLARQLGFEVWPSDEPSVLKISRALRAVDSTWRGCWFRRSR